ncbi:unnamed protein product [Pleuronectes platessa]|uniref:Uncharacterized protein n=1 Tax=Pleuronectes platessa TaxID=8262 RepID=A0A9N7Z1V0_PLEPL|nr:unnamed protein product [Pleuronectes platessa]
MKQTTARPEVFDQNSTKTTNGRPRTDETPTSAPGPGPTPRWIECKTTTSESTPGKLFSGLRMREDVRALEKKGDMKFNPSHRGRVETLHREIYSNGIKDDFLSGTCRHVQGNRRTGDRTCICQGPRW